MHSDQSVLIANAKVRSIIFIWSVLWLLIAGGTIYILPIFGADQFNKFYITSAYFFVFAVFGAYYYKITETLSHKAPFQIQLLFISICSLLLIAICLFFNRYFQINSGVYTKIMSSRFYFPLFKIETVTTKLFDVSFQQVFIFGLLKRLKEAHLPNGKILTLFALSFFIIHVPLVFSLSFLYAIYFIIPSLFAGLIFSYLILHFHFGQAIAFAVHLLFYLFIGIYLRF